MWSLISSGSAKAWAVATIVRSNGSRTCVRLTDTMWCATSMVIGAMAIGESLAWIEASSFRKVSASMLSERFSATYMSSMSDTDAMTMG